MMHAMAFAVAPRQPTGLAAASNGTAVNLSWTDGSLGETSFIVQRSRAGGPWTEIAQLQSSTGRTSGTTISYSDATIAGGVPYSYRVVANNLVGDTTVYPAPSVGFPTLSANSTASNVASVAAAACQTGADTSGNGSIGIQELLAYILGWKQGAVNMMNLLKAITFWKTGVGC